MPIYLRPPEHDPKGPDGKGWNRLTLTAPYFWPSPQCALRPRRYSALHECRRGTHLSQWGPYKPCIRPPAWGQHDGPDCRTCPVLTMPPATLDARGEQQVLIRVRTRTVGGGMATEAVDVAYVVTDPDAGWDSPKTRRTWEQLANLTGWEVGRQYHDEHGGGFWLHRVPAHSTQPAATDITSNR